MSADLNYARMPGMGDLPGDSRNPNSPDYVPVEPSADDVSDAIAAVASRMEAMYETGEFLEDLHNNGYAYRALDRLLSNTDAKALPYGDSTALLALLSKLRTLNEAVDAELEVRS